ncbi:MAG TPA: FAD-dependent oxidoreductase [Terracidiphilus sp.]|nr:FAD-dependent oxidoreductase [Terracidiphilus sp.]
MTSAAARDYDVIVAGGGIVGAACALACAQAGLHIALVEHDIIGGGATAAGMGHIVVMDDSEAQFALTRRSQQLWHDLAKHLPMTAEFETTGTIWVATDEEEFAEAERKHQYLLQRAVPSRMLSAAELAVAEPNLRVGVAGGLLVSEDAVVYPPVVALHLARQLHCLDAEVILGHISQFAQGEAQLTDGTRLRAPRLVNALGANSPEITPGIPLKKRKGHLAITDRYPGFVRHQLVELGYLKSAHSTTSDSVAFNVQPRQTGQILIGSSRQYGNEDPVVNQAILSSMLQRAELYMPAIGELNVIRIWTGFRAATPDKLPLIGPNPGDPTLWLATGHEGLGITTALATAELLACAFNGNVSPIESGPYLPARFDSTRPANTLIHQETV